MSGVYAVLTCDLRGSSKLRQEDRSKAQESIRLVIDYLEEIFPFLNGSATEFRFGDEWQLFVSRPETVYTIYSGLYYVLSFPFYCGVGIGDLSTPVLKDSHLMDGPVFHLARAALNHAKDGGRPVVFRCQPDSPVSQYETLLQSTADLIHRLRSGRRPSQAAIMIDAFMDSASRKSISSVDLAKRWNIHRTSAYRRLQSAGAFEEINMILTLEDLLFRVTRS